MIRQKMQDEEVIPIQEKPYRTQTETETTNPNRCSTIQCFQSMASAGFIYLKQALVARKFRVFNQTSSITIPSSIRISIGAADLFDEVIGGHSNGYPLALRQSF